MTAIERARAAARRRDQQAVGAVRLDDRELVHDVREMAAAGRADRRCRCSTRPRTAGPRGRARSRSTRRFHRAFERRAIVRGGADVEHQQHGRAAPGLVLAHHQVPAARGRPPVHVAQVVAGRVLAQRHEVAARLDPGAHGGVVAVEVETADVGRRRRSSWTRGYTMTCSVPSTRRLAETSPNGSRERRAQRTDLEAAAAIGREAVRGARLLAGRERREQEAGRPAALVERVGDRERRACAGSR